MLGTKQQAETPGRPVRATPDMLERASFGGVSKTWVQIPALLLSSFETYSPPSTNSLKDEELDASS